MSVAVVNRLLVGVDIVKSTSHHTHGIAAKNRHAKGYRYARTLGLAEITEGIVIVVFLIVLSRKGCG